MENCIPEFWEREREWKIAFPTFGNGNGNEKLIPKLWEREWEAGIPGNGREREFPLTPDLSPNKNVLVIHLWPTQCPVVIILPPNKLSQPPFLMKTRGG